MAAARSTPVPKSIQTTLSQIRTRNSRQSESCWSAVDAVAPVIAVGAVVLCSVIAVGAVLLSVIASSSFSAVGLTVLQLDWIPSWVEVRRPQTASKLEHDGAGWGSGGHADGGALRDDWRRSILDKLVLPRRIPPDEYSAMSKPQASWESRQLQRPQVTEQPERRGSPDSCNVPKQPERRRENMKNIRRRKRLPSLVVEKKRAELSHIS